MEKMLRRHMIVGLLGLILTYAFWMSRPQWVTEMRLWKSIGDASMMLLYATMILGPLARFVPRVGKLLPMRRELGIWFGVFAILHTLLIFDGWMRWDVGRFMGFEFLPALGETVRFDSGFGMANIVGLMAMLFTLPLMATSADWAIRAMGGNAWKFVHYTSYTIFYLVVLHTAYFLYIHFTISFHRPNVPDPNWFQYPFALLTVGVMALQLAAFFKTMKRTRHRKGRGKPTPRPEIEVEVVEDSVAQREGLV